MGRRWKPMPCGQICKAIHETLWHDIRYFHLLHSIEWRSRAKSKNQSEREKENQSTNKIEKEKQEIARAFLFCSCSPLGFRFRSRSCFSLSFSFLYVIRLNVANWNTRDHAKLFRVSPFISALMASAFSSASCYRADLGKHRLIQSCDSPSEPSNRNAKNKSTTTENIKKYRQAQHALEFHNLFYLWSQRWN